MIFIIFLAGVILLAACPKIRCAVLHPVSIMVLRTCIFTSSTTCVIFTPLGNW